MGTYISDYKYCKGGGNCARVVPAAGVRFGFEIEPVEFPWGCAYYLEHGEMMDADGLARLRDFDAIYLGAVGDPRVPDHVSLWGLLLRVRKAFDQYANVRPIRLLEGVPGPLAGRRPGGVGILL